MVSIGGRFAADTLCADLDPPCGGGACCAPDGTCLDTLPADCVDPNQSHGLATCDDVICNVFDDCIWDNGVGEPEGDGPASQYAPGEFFAEAGDLEYDRHGGGANVVFGDWHVRPVVPTDWPGVFVTGGDDVPQG